MSEKVGFKQRLLCSLWPFHETHVLLAWDSISSTHAREMELLRQEVDRERNEWARQRSELQENTAAKLSEVDRSLQSLRVKNKELRALLDGKESATADAVRNINSVQKELEAARTQNLQQEKKFCDVVRKHEETLTSRDRTHSAAYERLLRELKVAHFFALR